ncbi:MAG TPA: pseudouridine synthase [Xanthobacteraceae bacterium]|jgi:23S rRNA pseudouridine2605 synthase|nr:pseudouridine synthase [Xanthobacteraceae bacterium]
MNGNHNQDKSGERIAKVIARAGLASRREAEAWIEDGRVAVNGETIQSPARDVSDSDRVTVDGEPLPARERTRLFLYHKPRALMTTHADPQGRPTIFERLPADLPRLISVGRLDFNTEGLLLLTNDGALARALELPATGWLRRYRVRAHGALTQNTLDGLRKGVTISGIHYGAIDAAIDRLQGSNIWLTFAIREGKNREVRNVLTHLGLTVTRLIRVSFGPFQLNELEVGEVDEVPTRTLREQLGEKLTAQAGADFSAPVVQRKTARKPDDKAGPAKPEREKRKKRETSDHAWRAHEGDVRTKKLHRKFHGPHSRDETGGRPQGQARAATLTDRKGRTIAVKRYGEAPPKDYFREFSPEPRPQRGKRFSKGSSRNEGQSRNEQTSRHEGARHEGARHERPSRDEGPPRHKSRRRSPDRAAGPRPRNPNPRDRRPRDQNPRDPAPRDSRPRNANPRNPSPRDPRPRNPGPNPRNPRGR